MTTKQTKETWIQFIKFTLFSISAGVIQIASFSLLYEWLQFPYWPSYLVALTLSVIWNFTFNRKFTFKSAANVPIAMIKVAIFYAIFTPISTIAGHYLENNGWNGFIVLGATMIINFVTEFLYTRYVVYRHQINTAVK